MDTRMLGSRSTLLTAVLCIAVLTGGCDRLKKIFGGESADQGGEKVVQEVNKTDPHWVSQATPRNKIAVVFIHGIFGDTDGAWTNANGKTFFQFLKSADVGEKLDVLAFGFTTKMFERGSLDINEAATKLTQQMEYYKITDYESIVFVAHSMGGLITMKMISNNPNLTPRIPLLVFYATPQSGVQISRIADSIISNPALKEMYPANGNIYIRDLNENWVRVRRGPTPPTMICGYEKLETAGVMIVPWNEATKFCDDVAPAIASSDHISIVKPDREGHDAVVLLVNSIRRYVMPRLDALSWETPELRPEGDRWIYTLTDINAPNGASVKNKSGIVQQFTVEAEDPYRMMLLPQSTRYVSAGGQDLIEMLPIRDLQPEYRIKLKLGSAPERMIVARIPDLDTALAARAKRKSAVAEGVNAYFALQENVDAFNALPEPQQQEKIAKLAHTALAQQTAELPESARLLITADTLADIGWNQSATVTLQQTERAFPDTAKSASARHLAGVVAAQSGKRDIFRTVQTPQVNLDAVTNDQANLQLTNADRETWKQLAERMQDVPTMKSDGLVLEGDVLRAQGDSEGAKRAYLEARQLESSPMIDAKLRSQLER